MTDPATYGPWALVAGGSEGIGAAIASQLAEAGLDLVLVARKAGPLEETAARCREHGASVRTVAADLTDQAGLDRVRAETDDLEVGLLVLNAGANTYGHEFVTGDLDRFRKVVELNVLAPMALLHHFGSRMAERGRGGVLMIGSLAGYLGQAQISVYAATKAFVRVFAEGLWVELGERGVDLVELVAGVTRTPAMERAGLRLDLPGMTVSEPEDVARQALASLGKGPVVIAAGHERMARIQNGEDRAALVQAARDRSRDLLPAPDAGGPGGR